MTHPAARVLQSARRLFPSYSLQNTYKTSKIRAIFDAPRGQAARTQRLFAALANTALKLEGVSLSVGVMCTVAPVQFVSFLGRFRADNPGIEIALLEGVPDQLCDLLAKGELDVALMARPDGFSAPLQASKLYSERFVIACSAGHRFAMENEIRMTDLDGEFYLSRINCEF
jgi:DNA-binding transcriptional LysR family regulator